MSFWGELKRRNVFKVGAAYLIAAWLILQVASITFPALNLPEWTLTFVTVLLVIGFLIAIILAWAYEVTPDGVKPTKQVPLAESITNVTGKRLNYILAGLLIVAVGYIIALQFFINKPTVQTEMTSTVSEQTPPIVEVEEAPKTIAVLPFDNLSSDQEQEFFVEGLSEEIINCIVQIPDLKVTGKTSSFSFKGSNKTVQEIANVLGVENILEGSVRKAGDDLRITAQLLRAEDGFHLFSKTYDRKFEDIFAIQEDIASAVADELSKTLGLAHSYQRLGGTENMKAYELYLFARGQWGSGGVQQISRALESIDAALTLDPEFALAWAMKGIFQSWLTVFKPSGKIQAELDMALHAAQKAIKLESDLPEANYSLGVVSDIRGDWGEAELSFRKYRTQSHNTHIDSDGYAVLLMDTGHIRSAREILETARQHDPLNQNIRGLYILCLGILGKTQQAETEYTDGKALFGDRWEWGDNFFMPVRLGTGDVVSPDDVWFSDPIYETAKAHLHSAQEGLAELHRLYNDKENLSSVGFEFISMWAAYFGDFEFAMDAMEKAVEFNGGNNMYFWLPLMQEVRQLPRFKEFLQEIGIVDYWEQFGWPDICRPLDNGDFVCD